MMRGGRGRARGDRRRRGGRGCSCSTRSTCSTTSAGASCDFRHPDGGARLRRAPARASTRCASASRRASPRTLRRVELLVPYGEGGPAGRAARARRRTSSARTRAEGVRVPARAARPVAARYDALRGQRPAADEARRSGGCDPAAVAAHPRARRRRRPRPARARGA